jgi:hypothetical protein
MSNISEPLDGSYSNFGPSGVSALPLAAGINEGGHYFRYFGLSGVRALPLAAGINEGGHYFRYFFLLFSFFLVLVLTTAIQNHRRGCRRVSNFCMGS